MTNDEIIELLQNERAQDIIKKTSAQKYRAFCDLIPMLQARINLLDKLLAIIGVSKEKD